MGHDNEEETKFFKSRSKYGVFNYLHFTFDVDGTYEFYYRYGRKRPEPNFYCIARNTSRSIRKQYTVFIQNTNNKWIDGTFLEYLEHLLVIPYHLVWIVAPSMVGFMLSS